MIQVKDLNLEQKNCIGFKLIQSNGGYITFNKQGNSLIVSLKWEPIKLNWNFDTFKAKLISFPNTLKVEYTFKQK